MEGRPKRPYPAIFFLFTSAAIVEKSIAMNVEGAAVRPADLLNRLASEWSMGDDFEFSILVKPTASVDKSMIEN